jgi:alpha-tubulin suppressor-like RCC1 family protein
MGVRPAIGALLVVAAVATSAPLSTVARAATPPAIGASTGTLCSVCTWGEDGARQLGFASASGHRTTAAAVPGVGGLTAVAAGGDHSLAVRSDGTVWAWGSNDSGRLGDGTTKPRSTAVRARGLARIVAVAAGSYHSLALDTSGDVWGWGGNDDGQVGDGSAHNARPTPVRTHSISGVTAISAGGDFSLALRADGTVWSWGGGTQGELGQGDSVVWSRLPRRIHGLSDVVGISAGVSHGLAVRRDGTVWAWGANSQGETGQPSSPGSSVPLRVHGVYNIVAVSAGVHHSTALRRDGTVWAWGFNLDGELGDGTTDGRVTPRRVHDLFHITAIAAGAFHTLARRSDGTLWSWGWNCSGQLGDGTLSTRTTPVRVHRLPHIGVVATGSSAYHALVLAG